MARHATKKKQTPRPGWVAAARDLGVTYSHLRRVLTGDRTGKSLRAKFRAWKNDHRAAEKLLARTDAHLAGLQQNIPAMRRALRQPTA